ncbi:hypothetical protein HanRHA438_Chr13g0582471 [Helianthus annuus]|nr:hypothetical protein HanRHA438_Chr13g0582471 [Helianthus annuus]
MVKPNLDLWTRTDPIFRVVNRFCNLCSIGSLVGSGNGRVGFFLLLTRSFYAVCLLIKVFELVASVIIFLFHILIHKSVSYNITNCLYTY